MPKSKQPATRTPVESNNAEQANKHGFFPFARYTSIVGVHTTLIAFVGLFFPRSTLFFNLDGKHGPLTSRDKPQHPFLAPITSSPLGTLICLCLGVAMLQSWWGGWVRLWAIEWSLVGSDEEKRMKRAKQNKNKIKEILGAWRTTVACSLVVHVILVLFGAPITSRWPHTYLLATLISLLAVFPAAYTLGPPSFASDTASLVGRLTWVRLFAEISPQNPIERAIVYPAIGTLVGCWVGVIPIALDWDRPWQAWPLTPSYGGIIGYIVTSIVTLAINGGDLLANMNSQATSPQKTKFN